MSIASARIRFPVGLDDDSFLDTDEAALTTLSNAWFGYADHLTETFTELRASCEQLSHRSAADTPTVRRRPRAGWLEAIAATSDPVASAVESAAQSVSRTKHAIHLVLTNLQTTASQLMRELASTPLINKAEALVRFRQLHLDAHTECQALSAALLEDLAALDVAVDVQPSGDCRQLPGVTADDRFGLLTGLDLPTQFGVDDRPFGASPPDMGTPYQLVLLPQEAEALLTGHLTTLCGLVHPLDQVQHLTTPAELFDALGLGYVLNQHAADPRPAFDRREAWVDVLRFTGVRGKDLVVPLADGVDASPTWRIRPMVRDHAAPWTGTGYAPGTTRRQPIAEFEILSSRALTIPHAAELWRLYDEGPAQHVATWDAASAAWHGSITAGSPGQMIGRPSENGSYAVLDDGTTFRATPLTDTHTVVFAYGAHAPADFTAAADGSRRLTVSNDRVTRWLVVQTTATWRSPAGPVPVQVIHRTHDRALVGFIGHERARATACGFRQLGQGRWAPLWVPWQELTGQQEQTETYPRLHLIN